MQKLFRAFAMFVPPCDTCEHQYLLDPRGKGLVWEQWIIDDEVGVKVLCPNLRTMERAVCCFVYLGFLVPSAAAFEAWGLILDSRT